MILLNLASKVFWGTFYKFTETINCLKYFILKMDIGDNNNDNVEEFDEEEENVNNQENNNFMDLDDNEEYSGIDSDYDWTTSGSDSYCSDDDPDITRAAYHKLMLNSTRRRKKQKPIYKFQPFTLLKVVYKLRNAVCNFPNARSGHRIIATEANLFALGGYNPGTGVPVHRRGGCALFQELWCFNFASKRWKLVLNGTDKNYEMPKELASNALTLYKNVIISHGGTGFPFGEVCSSECHVFSTNTKKPYIKHLHATGELPAALYGPAVVIHDNYLYTIGGTTGFEYSCDVFRLNLNTNVWEAVYFSRPELRDDPEGRYRHEIVYDGSYIYVLGGGTSSIVYDLQQIPAFNLKTNSWSFCQTFPDMSKCNETLARPDSGFPSARKCFSCVQNTLPNGDVEAFITGGMQVCAADFSVYFNDIWKLNLRTKQWTHISTANLPRPLYFHDAAESGNGCMYIFGGIEYDEKDLHRRNDLYKIWMTIPKLSEICWDAITYYNETIHEFGRDKLLSVGIPNHFVERLEFNVSTSSTASTSRKAIKKKTTTTTTTIATT